MLQRRGDRLELYRLKDGGPFGGLEPLDSGLDSGPQRRTVSGLPCATSAPCSNEMLWSASAIYRTRTAKIITNHVASPNSIVNPSQQLLRAHYGS